MPLETQPPGEDGTNGVRGLPVPFYGPGAGPPGEDGIERGRHLENSTQRQAAFPDGVPVDGDTGRPDFLALVRQAEQQSQLYTAQVNRKAWSMSYRAFHNEHFSGSKYTRPDYRMRSRLFVPKTRGAVRKDMAAVASSLFNTYDAINCRPGNESDARQRAAAAVMEELVNYRTDRASGKAAFPWFLIAMGARQDATITGICVSKQFWRHEFRKSHEEQYSDTDQLTGDPVTKRRDVFVLEIDRPDIKVFPPENVIIDPAAPWEEAAQKASYLILKYPMTVDEVMEKQDAPINPWLPVSESALRQASNLGKQDMEAIRRAREMGLDRLDETQTGKEFQIIWVYECFMRIGGEDWNWWSVGDQYYLTDPKTTREAYPAHFGERPVSYGYGQLESHRIFPMSAVESWQPLQVETNDIRNLQLDATKQNVMPISKVVRGKRIDMDQVKRRASGSSIFVDNPTDVTWETPPAQTQDATLMTRQLELEIDDLAGVQNYGNVENNNALGKTLGGLKLAAGASNAVQEFDIRVWIETWANKALSQVVQLEQYYESDPIILGLCGQRAQLFEKYGIDQIDDKLLEEQVTINISVGLGAGDPQQRLAKFQTAIQVLTPIMQFSQEFQSGQVEINWEEMWQEVMGAVGYGDGGMRFVKVNQGPRPNQMADLKTQELQAKIEKDKKTGQAAMITSIAQVAKVALGRKELEAGVVDNILGHQLDARRMGFEHGDRHSNTHLAAIEHGHRHGLAIAQHRHDVRSTAFDQMQSMAAQAGEGADEGAAPQSSPRAASAPSQNAASPAPPGNAAAAPSPPRQVEFIRHPETNEITGARMPEGMDMQKAAESAEIEQRLDRLEAMIERLAQPRKRRIIRDEHGRVQGSEDVL